MTKDELLQELAKTLCHAQRILGEVLDADVGEDAPSEPNDVVASPPTLVDVRTALMPIARSGKSDEIRGLLLKHGANSLTELDPGKYATILAEAEVLR